MTDENKEQEFEIEEVDLLRIQASAEKQQRLQYTIKDLYDALVKEQKKVEKAKSDFDKKYTEEGKYQITSVDEERCVGKRVLAENENNEEDPEEFDVVMDEDSNKDE